MAIISLTHGGSPKEAELITCRWADHRKVPQVAFRLDWAKHGRLAPFKRSDALLDVLPIGVLVPPALTLLVEFRVDTVWLTI